MKSVSDSILCACCSHQIYFYQIQFWLLVILFYARTHSLSVASDLLLCKWSSRRKMYMDFMLWIVQKSTENNDRDGLYDKFYFGVEDFKENLKSLSTRNSCTSVVITM